MIISVIAAVCAANTDGGAPPPDTVAGAPPQNADADSSSRNTVAAELPSQQKNGIAPLSISYTGSMLSFVIPGSGQIYHGRYFMGGVFLASEVIVGGVAAIYWFDTRGKRHDEYRRFSDSAAVTWGRGALSGDSVTLYNAGLYSVYADQMEFEVRRARYTAYNALSWTVGIHLYNFMDALGLDGIKPSGEAKNPATAGLLAAAPFLGLGQLYNGNPGKAGMMAMTQTSLVVTAINHQRLMDRAFEKYNEMRDSTTAQYAYRAEHLGYWKGLYDKNFSRRNTYLWMYLFSQIYSILDAVVDAHLSDYDRRMQIGPDLAVGAGGTGVGVLMRAGF